MKGARNTIKITGGTIQGSAVGIGRVEQYGTTIGASATVEDLRTLLAERGDAIAALGRDDEERSDLRHEVRRIQKALAVGEPDGNTIRTRWNAVLQVVKDVMGAGTTITGITELIQQLFGC